MYTTKVAVINYDENDDYRDYDRDNRQYDLLDNPVFSNNEKSLS